MWRRDLASSVHHAIGPKRKTSVVWGRRPQGFVFSRRGFRLLHMPGFRPQARCFTVFSMTVTRAVSS
jgi:hypothetical protein